MANLEGLYLGETVGSAARPRITQDLVLVVLDQAGQRYRPPAGLLHHSDRRSQYAAQGYQARRVRSHMTGSMSLTGNCWDGACIESWHSLLKQELVHCSRFRTRTEVTRRSSKSIAIFYNRHRLHSALGYRIPAEVEADGAD